MYEFLLQGSSLLEGVDISQTFRIITYIITAVIGGVGYKYLKLYFNHKVKSTDQNQKASENLVNNLEERIQSLTKRVNELESKREQSYERELKLTKTLAKAEQKVEFLENKIETLEKNHKVLSDTVDKYYKKFGPIDEESKKVS